MADIIFGKFGKSLLFDKRKWSPVGGDMEAPYTLLAFAKYYPEHTFWIISKNDFEIVYPNASTRFKNIKNCWNPKYFPNGELPERLISTTNEKTMNQYQEYILNVFKIENVHPEFGIIFSGVNTSNSLEFNKYIPEKKRYVHGLNVAIKYMSYIVYMLNTLNVPYISVLTDPRQILTNFSDLLDLPLFYASQFDEEVSYGYKTPQYWKNKPYTVNYNAVRKIVYAKTEFGSMLFRKPIQEVKHFDKDWFRKKHGFNMIVNEGFKQKYDSSRYDILKEYILNNPDFDCSIYGKWSDDIIKNEPRFKGHISPLELGSILNETKYTFCIPIRFGWMTSKFIEMCHYGVIPFVHKSYASEVKSKTYIDPYFVCSDKDDLFKKIQELESDESKYFSVIEKIRNILFEHGDSIYTGVESVCNIVKSIYDNTPQYAHIFEQKNLYNESEYLSDYASNQKISMSDFF